MSDALTQKDSMSGLMVEPVQAVSKRLETLQLLPMWTMGKRRSLTRCFWPETFSAATRAQVN